MRKRWGQKYDLMERVRRYCTMVGYRKERAVFTREQWRHICHALGPALFNYYPGLQKGQDTLFGVPFTIDDTPRPQMRI